MKEFIIENEYLKVKLLDYGARIISLIYKPLNRNLVLGYENIYDYIKDPNYFGATVGFNANRIKDAKFNLENKTYELDKNDGNNNNHSGKFGLDKKIWDADIKEDRIEFNIKEKEPFIYKAKVIYELEDKDLKITIQAKGEETSLFNFTNHTYFNLEENYEEGIYNHKLKLYSNKITPTDNELIPTEEILNVDSTIYNFNKEKLLGEMIENNLKSFGSNKGYDINYIMEKASYQKLGEVSVKDLSLSVYSDSPAFQLYTGNFIKINNEDRPYLGLCIEAQNVPNSINSDKFIKPIYIKDQIFERNITYSFR